MILDVRNNYGGHLDDLHFLIGQLIDEPLRIGYTRYKSGSGRLDYSPWIEASVKPQVGAVAFKYPVVALTDNFTVSLAEAAAMAVHAMPRGRVVGEKTWGATGPLVGEEVYNSGQFDIPNFLTVYTASAAFKYIDGTMYENIGFPPDTEIPFNQQTLLSGKDPALEKAIQSIGQ